MTKQNITSNFSIHVARFQTALLIVGVSENSAPQAILAVELVCIINLFGVVIAINYFAIIAATAR
jgi:hypothetical protein